MPAQKILDPDDDEVLHKTDEVFQVLKLLEKRKIQLTIIFPGQRKQFVSMVLRVDKTIRRYVLDEISPSEGHRLALAGQPFHIRTRVQGAEVAIRNQHSETVGKEDGGAYYILPLPKEITYIQRRDAYRVNLPDGLHAEIEIRNPETGATHRGHLLDISGTGCRARFSDLDASKLSVKQHLKECRISVPGTSGVELSAEILGLSSDEQAGTVTCGLHFLDLTSGTDKAIFRLVNVLQRKSIRAGQDDSQH